MQGFHIVHMQKQNFDHICLWLSYLILSSKPIQHSSTTWAQRITLHMEKKVLSGFQYKQLKLSFQ